MQNTSPRPPAFARWLSFERRHAIAMWLRDKAAWAAEWICPELKAEIGEGE
jgi:hypothetical protein